MKRIPTEITRFLEETNLPYELRRGSNHTKLFICGRMAGVISHNWKTAKKTTRRNNLAQIKRFCRDIQNLS